MRLPYKQAWATLIVASRIFRLSYGGSRSDVNFSVQCVAEGCSPVFFYILVQSHRPMSNYGG